MSTKAVDVIVVLVSLLAKLDLFVLQVLVIVNSGTIESDSADGGTPSVANALPAKSNETAPNETATLNIDFLIFMTNLLLVNTSEPFPSFPTSLTH
jgi:hypothetical protein